MNDLQLAQICQMSYADKPGAGWYDVQDLRFGILPLMDGSFVVCARGSANFRNWLRDFFVIPRRSFDGYLVHGGVNGAVNTLKPLVRALLPLGAKVVFTGHSLGGGIARELGRMFCSPSVTFGCPKVDYRFGASPSNDHRRIVCDDDPVPMVPGALYVQCCAASLVLSDPGPAIDPKDHFISHYIDRLQAKDPA